MTEDARQRVEQALLQMVRLAAPCLPPAENLIAAELRRKYEDWPPEEEADAEPSRAAA